MKNTLFTLLTIFATSSFSIAQNGYSLEFEDVVTLSVESAIAFPIGATGSKTYTVPANMVLKISTGCLQYTTNSMYATLTIGSETITGIQTVTSTLWPIWASSGTTVTLAFANISGTSKEMICGFITGTLFRKVPN